MLIGANLLGHVINTVVAIVMRRTLGVDRVGVRDWAVNYGTVPSVVGEMGLTRAAVIESAKKQNEELPEVLGHLTATRFATTFIYLGMVVVSLLLPFNAGVPASEKLLVLMWSLAVVFQTFRRNAEAGFLATEKLRYQATLALLNRTLAAAGVLLVFWLLRDRIRTAPSYSAEWYSVLYWMVAVYVLSDFIDAALGFFILRRSVAAPRFNLDWRPKLQLLLMGWPFALQMLAGQLYYYIDTPLLRYRFAGEKYEIDREVGYYTTAYTIILVLIQLPINLTHALFPQMARAHYLKDSARLYSLFRYGLQLMLIGGLPLAALFFLFRSELIPLIYGSDYVRSISMLGILAWTLPLAFVNAQLSLLLGASEHPKSVAFSMLASAAFNFTSNFFLIPQYGGMATSTITLGTEAVLFAFLFAGVLRYHPQGLRTAGLLPVLLLQAVAAVAFLVVHQQSLAVRLALFLFYVLVIAWGLIVLFRKRREGLI